MNSSIETAIQAISGHLDKLEKISQSKYIFRCPICGDSRSNPDKKRGAIYELGGTVFFSCFNCMPEAKPFEWFLRLIDERVYREFRLGKLKEEFSFNTVRTKEEPKKKDEDLTGLFSRSLFSSLLRMDQAKTGHPALSYLRKRLTPRKDYARLFYVEDFEKWSVSINPRLPLEDRISAPGIVFPLISPNGDEFGYQCRFLEGSVRYRTIMMSENEVKCFGLDRINRDEDINVTEGSFDSFYLKNSIASLDASLHGTCRKIEARYGIPSERFVLWFDAEPLNKQIVKLKTQAVQEGYRVAFYDPSVMTHKDINETLTESSDAKYSLKQIMNTTKILAGSRAKIELSSLSKFI